MQKARALALCVAVVGTGAPFQARAQAGRCDPAKVEGLKGQMFSPQLADQARTASGATTVRPVGPGMVSSSDRRPNRLNVEVDPKGAVTGFWCE